ncbi:MAG TPA: acetate--CoA ligase family protein [Burkholderiales bacterium]|jgi:acyl-CoA synthetase (NDP forming)|nr:acetate--CoA ligase family protein [Burkholderiales bacterium]
MVATRPLYTRAQLERMLAPRSIAIVGASPRAASFGVRTLENLAHFKGCVYPVNAKYKEVGGRACYASLAELPEKPDCVVLVVPREVVEQSIKEAAAVGAGSVIVYASGYGEMAHQDAGVAQQRLVEIARAARMPILGPNCMGLVNHGLGAGMTFIPEYSKMPRRTGPIAFVSQSGALGYCLAQAAERGLGYRYFASAGNSADVDIADLIGAMAGDDDVRAIACLFEGLPDARRLLEAGERARSAGKPVIVYKLGVSDDGAAAARSHTGSLAGSAEAFRALFDRAGFVQVDDYEALVEYAKFFAAAGKPLARGVAVVSGSGGAGIIAADMAARHGVPMPQPGEQATSVLKSIVPEFGAARNPCDPTGQVLSVPESYDKCCRALMGDPQYGVLLCIMSVSSHETGTMRAARIATLAREQPKPIAVVWVSEWLQGPGSQQYESDDRVGFFRSLDRCYATIAAWQRWHQGGSANPARVSRKVDFKFDKKILGEREAKTVLGKYGIKSAPERQAKNADEAVKAASELGYPVVLKADGDIEHKTEAGAVKLDLRDEAALRAACGAMTAARNGFLVQQMVKGGVELVVGIKRDPQCGPVLLVGLGGVLVEVLRDTALALAPVGKAEARRMLQGLKGFRLLQGYRGAPAADLDAVCDAIARISEFAADHADAVEEIDVNPLLARPDGAVALDALIVLRKP